jgi:Asp-tRNA(Asn)/Glu-tRNA(Gln) amidotransferase A subunit family amidase
MSDPDAVLDAAPGPVWRELGPGGAPLVAATGTGPLDGLRVAVKDLFAVAGHRVGAGVPARLAESPVAERSASAVAALLDAGAQVRGIAQTDELAYSVAGANPHHGTPPNVEVPGALPGGSSSGPATAVASGRADIGLATDTAGSVRVPASYQGLWGLRTTHGRIARDGLVGLAPSFDTVGWLTRDAGTLAAVVEVAFAGPVSGSASGSAPASVADAVPPAPRLVWAPALLDEVEMGTALAFDALLDRLRGDGALPGVEVERLHPRDLPDLDEAHDAFRTVQGAEAWRLHGAWVSAHPGALGDAVAGRFELARHVTPARERAARELAAELADQVRAAVGDRVLLLPSTPGPAPRADTRRIDAIRMATLRLTTLAALAGLPALSAPLLRAPLEGAPVTDAPVGLCLVGAAGTDEPLVRLGARLAAASVAGAPERPDSPTPDEVH